MALVITDDKHYTDIANAIRVKNGATAEYKPSDMSAAIEALVTSSGGEDAIVSDKNIGDYSNDRVTSLPSYAFAYRRSMTSVSLPNVTQIAAQTFTTCSSLVTAELPSLTTITSTANFGACSALQYVDLGFANAIQASTFSNCTALNTIILRKTSVCNLVNINAFAGTPFASGGAGGTVYVPSALIEQYEMATNWSVLFGYGTVVFAALESLEGSEYK